MGKRRCLLDGDDCVWGAACAGRHWRAAASQIRWGDPFNGEARPAYGTFSVAVKQGPHCCASPGTADAMCSATFRTANGFFFCPDYAASKESGQDYGLK